MTPEVETTVEARGDLEIVLRRIFDAPPDLVFEAHTKPEHLKNWWGLRGSILRVCEVDLRPGGKWRFISHAADRDDVEFYGEYLEIEAPVGYRWTFMFDVDGFGPMGGPESHVLEDLGDGRTKLTSTGHMGSPEAIEGALCTGMAEGAIETWDRLEELLAEG